MKHKYMFLKMSYTQSKICTLFKNQQNNTLYFVLNCYSIKPQYYNTE